MNSFMAETAGQQIIGNSIIRLVYDVATKERGRQDESEADGALPPVSSVTGMAMAFLLKSFHTCKFQQPHYCPVKNGINSTGC